MGFVPRAEDDEKNMKTKVQQVVIEIAKSYKRVPDSMPWITVLTYIVAPMHVPMVSPAAHPPAAGRAPSVHLGAIGPHGPLWPHGNIGSPGTIL